MGASQLVLGLSIEQRQPIEQQLKLWDDSSIWEILWKKLSGGTGIDIAADRLVSRVYEGIGVESIDHSSELRSDTDWRLAKLLRLAEHAGVALPRKATSGELHSLGLAIERKAVARLRVLDGGTWYHRVLRREARSFRGHTVEDLVRHTVAKVFEQLQQEFDKLDPAKQREVLGEIESALRELGPEQQEKLRRGANLESLSTDALARSGSLASLGLGLAGLVSVAGFGAYTTLTTVMAALAGAVGMTLPFSAYIAATSLLAFLTNPLVLMAGGGAAGLAVTRSTNRKIRDNLMCILLTTSCLCGGAYRTGDATEMADRLAERVRDLQQAEARRRARLQRAYPGLEKVGGFA